MEKYKYILLAILWFNALPLVNAQDIPDITGLYAPYTDLLDRYLIEERTTENGLVSAFDYRSAMNDPSAEERIEEQKEKLVSFDPESIRTREQALSFWINAYNFFMLAYILEHPEHDGRLIDGVRDYGSFINPYWVFKQEIFNIGGTSYSLDTIEKEILLGEEYKKEGWKDARVHFAVNCASVGCPPLRERIYTPDTVNSMLTENTRLALQTPRHLRFENGILYLTRLFKWYKKDFVEEAGSIRAFLKQYTPSGMHRKIEAAGVIRFIDYDWTLNRPSNFSEISRTTGREHTNNRG